MSDKKKDNKIEWVWVYVCEVEVEQDGTVYAGKLYQHPGTKELKTETTKVMRIKGGRE